MTITYGSGNYEIPCTVKYPRWVSERQCVCVWGGPELELDVKDGWAVWPGTGARCRAAWCSPTWTRHVSTLVVQQRALTSLSSLASVDAGRYAHGSCWTTTTIITIITVIIIIIITIIISSSSISFDQIQQPRYKWTTVIGDLSYRFKLHKMHLISVKKWHVKAAPPRVR